MIDYCRQIEKQMTIMDSSKIGYLVIGLLRKSLLQLTAESPGRRVQIASKSIR